MKQVFCRKCGCEMELVNDGQRAGAAVGGAVGATAGLIGSCSHVKRGMQIGAVAGSCIPIPGGRQIGSATGAIVAATTGFLTGTIIGGEVGRQIDRTIVRKFRCPQCETVVTA